MSNKEFWKNYQEQAWTTCMPSCQNDYYLGHAFLAEVGELAGVTAKKIRGDYDDAPEKFKQLLLGEIGDCLWFLFSTRKFFEVSDIIEIAPLTELTIWYKDIEIDIAVHALNYIMRKGHNSGGHFYGIMSKLQAIALRYGFTLEAAATYNLEKLSKRYKTDKIMGSGDYR